jgi:prepilin-type N-terminal cleavage/methylation domain-containing protein
MILKQSRQTSGFTLIEVMVSVAIVGMLMTFMSSGLSVGLDSWERGTDAIREMQSRASVERLLRRQLALALPYEVAGIDESFILFEGDTHRLEFVSSYSLMDGPIDARKIDYRIQDGRFDYGESVLFDYQADVFGEEDLQPLVEFSTVEFRYLGTDLDGDLEWLTEWERGMGLPRAVQIRVDDDYVVVPLVY